jgi:acetyl-CoA C-acetyltransferase
MASVQGAAASIMAGMDKVVIAGGSESLSTSPTTMKRKMGTDEYEQWMSPSHPATPDAPAFDMSITVGYNTAQSAGLTRADCDAWALRSHERAIAAIDEGRLQEEIVAIEVTMRDGTTKIFDTDEHPRRGSTAEKMASLKPLHPEIDDFPITAGNSSGLNDGAAALVIASEEKAKELGIEPLGFFLGSAAAGVDPRVMGVGPIPAVQKVLARTGVDVGSLDLVELNEAFASQSLAVIRELGLDPEKVNVNGGAIALGHPLGMSGARLVVSLLHELRRRDGRYGLATLCVGVGQGQAALFERSV